MFCRHCGKAMPPDARFCAGCGAERQQPSSSEVIIDEPRTATGSSPGARVISPAQNGAGLPAVSRQSGVPAPASSPGGLTSGYPAAGAAQSPFQNVNVAPPAYTPHANQTVNVYVAQPMMARGDDTTFAWLTVLAYFLFWPLGALMNFIGLFTGPNRGCFVAMLFVFFFPSVVAIVVLILAIAGGAFANM